MEVSILNIINSKLAINEADGSLLFEAISSIKPADLTISFDGIERVSTGFLNQSIGKYAIAYSSEIKFLNLDVPSEKEIFRFKVEDVVENALLGDAYNNLVDRALISI